ncbi:type II secretion system protein [Jutongia sp.]
MKKVIKNYLAKLQENDKKGFSLVELIIVMAIMAILVGIVASQVLPYMEKSRQSKDQQVLSNICTDVVSAIAQADQAVDSFSEVKVEDLSSGAVSSDAEANKVAPTFKELHGTVAADDMSNTLKSKLAKDKNYAVLIDYTVSAGSKGTVKVYVSGDTANKLTVTSD